MTRQQWNLEAIQERLKRGTMVRVRRTFNNKNYWGQKAIVASVRLCTCNERSAANEAGPGKAVFVALPHEFQTDVQKGWLKNTVKVGIHHLETLAGEPIVDLPADTEPWAPPAPDAALGTPSELDQAVVSRALYESDPEQLVMVCQRLLLERDGLYRKLVVALEENNRLLREQR